MSKYFRYEIGKFLGLSKNSENSLGAKPGESPDMLNMKIIPGHRLKKRDGYKVVKRFDDPIDGLWCSYIGDEEHMVVISGGCLYRMSAGEAIAVGELETNGKVSFLSFFSKIYILTGSNIYCYDGSKVAPIEPYCPLILVSCAPDGSGTPYEDINLLCGRVRQTYSPDENTTTFYTAMDMTDYHIEVRVNGEMIDDTRHFCDKDRNMVVLNEAPGEGENTVEITYYIDPPDKSRILSCRYAAAFGGDNDTRVFLWGNPDYPSMRFYSRLASGMPSVSYFAEADCSIVGDGEAITEIIRHYDRQLIFTKNSAYYSYFEQSTDQLGRRYASFPVYPLSSSCGNVVCGGGVLVDNSPLTFFGDGIYRWNSTNIRDERNAVCISDRIRDLLRDEELREAVVFDREATGELYIALDNRIYVYNYRLDVFYLYRGPRVRAFCIDGEDRLYFASADGCLCEVSGHTDDGEPIAAHWLSGEMDFGESFFTKNLHSVTLSMNPLAKTDITLGWITDSGSSVNSRLSPGFWGSVLDFSLTDFSRFVFYTGSVSTSLTRRVNAKRFRSVRLFIKGGDDCMNMEICTVAMKGSVNDGKVK